MNPDQTDNDELGALVHQRGRKRLSPVPDVRMRCDPPESLSEIEKAIWRGIVEKVRPGWFYSSEALLRAYVGTVAQLETLARGLAEEEPCSRRYFQILRLQLATTKTAAMLATRLRLTPRSTVDRYSPKIVRSGPKPWEFDPSEA